MENKISEKYPTDEELHNSIKSNDVQTYASKLNTAYIVQLRFTDSLWNVLHLAVYYQNKEFVELALDLESSTKLIQGKDKNGETPLHLACFHTNAEIALLLLSRGASFYTRNIYQKDPIDVIQNYVKRKAFLKFLISNKTKMSKKELDFLVEHQSKCDYFEALGEIIYAKDNVHQFKIERGLVIKPDFDIIRMQTRSRKENVKRLKEFKMGFRVKEDFYLSEKDERRLDVGDGKKVQLREDIMEKRSLFLNPISSHVDMNNYASPLPYQFSEVPMSLNQVEREVMSEIVTPDAANRILKKMGSKKSMFYSKRFSPEKPNISITPVRPIEEKEEENPPEPSVFGKSGVKKLGSSMKKMKKSQRVKISQDENLFNSNNFDDLKLSTVTDNYKTINQSRDNWSNLKSSLKKNEENPPVIENKLKKSRERKSDFNGGFTKIKQSLDEMEDYSKNRKDIYSNKNQRVLIKTRKLQKDESSRSLRSKFLKDKLKSVKEKKQLSKRKNSGVKNSSVILERGRQKDISKNLSKRADVYKENDDDDDPYKTFHFKENPPIRGGRETQQADSFFGKLDKFQLKEKKNNDRKKKKKKSKKPRLVIYDS